MNKWYFVCILFLCSVSALAAEAQPTYSLTPGKAFEIPMQDLGATSDDKGARAGVFLPNDYSPEKSYPCCVFFGGGYGGVGTWTYQGITEKNRWIIVALPYKKGLLWGSPIEWYITMMDRVHKIVPNINKDLVICSGFSSGGGAAGNMSGCSLGMNYFCAGIPAGLAGRITSVDKAKVKGWPMLIVIGERDTSNGRMPSCKALHQQALSHGMDVELHIMKGIGHEFNAVSWPTVREFLAEKVIGRYYKRTFFHMDTLTRKKKWSAALTVANNAMLVMNKKFDGIYYENMEKRVEAIYKAAETELAKVKKADSESKLEKFIDTWEGAPCVSEAKELHNEFGGMTLAKILEGAESGRLDKVKKFVLKWHAYPVFNEVKEYYDSEANKAFEKLAESIEKKDQKKMQSFCKKWPYSQAAVKAMDVRIAAAREFLAEMKATTKRTKLKSKAKKFVKSFADVDNVEIQQAIEMYRQKLGLQSKSRAKR